MKRIGNSKEPTPARMLAIASNLREHFNCCCTVDITAWGFRYGDEVNYSIYVEKLPECRINFETWPELVAGYRKLREESPNAS